MQYPEGRRGFIGSVVGSTIGMTLWIILLGIFSKSLIAIIIPIIFGFLSIGFSIKLFDKYPERRFAIVGTSALWLTVLNSMFINLFISGKVGTLRDIGMGDSSQILLQMNFFLICMAILGCGFIINDIRGQKK